MAQRVPTIRATDDGRQFVSVRDLQDVIFGGEVPEEEQWRRFYGRTITPQIIESVIRQADWGSMRDLTDLEYETVFMEPHLGALLGKRFRAIAATDWSVVPAAGPGLDPTVAERAAELVRAQFSAIPNLRQNLVRLTWGHFHGRASLEKQWEYSPNAGVPWKIRALGWIHPRRLQFGPERELRVCDDLWTGTGFEKRGTDLRTIPHKWISFTPQLFNDYPEREGLGPRCLYWAFFKRFSQRERMILLEVFGKPWRIVTVAADAHVQKAQLDLARQTADDLGANATAAMPQGVDLQIEQPVEGAGKVHAEVIADADDNLSKLVLGQTRTTDAKPGALGSSADGVAQDEQSLIIAADGWNLGDAFTEQLARDIVILNGFDAVYTPRINIIATPPPDRTAEIERTGKVLAWGIPLKKSQVYERAGFDAPQAGDEVIQIEQGLQADPKAVTEARQRARTILRLLPRPNSG